MKTVRWVAILFGVGLLLVLSTLIASADSPILVANATAPFNARYIDNQAHPIMANSDVWTRFDYTLSTSGKTQMTTLRLLYGNQSGLAFEIYEPMDMNAYSDAGLSPVVGRGSPEMLECSSGWCAGDNLVWTGALGATGTYFVRIINTTSYTLPYLLTAEGKGVIVTAPIAVTGVSAATQNVVNYDDPNKAMTLDGKQQLVPANSTAWFKFDYTANASNPTVDHIRLLYGIKSGLKFEVYSPEILGNWWENDPIGLGVPEMASCSTGFCQTDDLIWVGAFGATGTYYVRIINNTAYEMPALLTMQ